MEKEIPASTTSNDSVFKALFGLYLLTITALVAVWALIKLADQNLHLAIVLGFITLQLSIVIYYLARIAKK